jgi:SAM-dependent methyltransferase
MARTESRNPRTFYDEHPFDWAPSGPQESMRSVVSPLLADLIEGLDSKSLVFDVGCGPGRVLSFLTQRGVRCVGIDRSRVSLGLAKQRFGSPGVVADNLRLPFADGAAGVLISDGVIHHTENPEAAFAENCRVLKPGGEMYLAVYKPFGHYPWIFKYPGALIRSGTRHAWSKPLVTVFAQFPYFLVHYIRSKGRRTWAGAKNLFYDYFITPRVVFLSRDVIEDWCTKHGARIALYDENRVANVHSFCLVKEREAHAADVLAEAKKGAE